MTITVVPEDVQPKLEECGRRLLNGFYSRIPDGFRDYLIDRLEGNAAPWHITAREGHRSSSTCS